MNPKKAGNLTSVRLVLRGDMITASFRRKDRPAIERGEKVYIDCIQNAHDFVAIFVLPKDAEVLRMLCETEKFCQLHRQFKDIHCESLPNTDRIYYAHDGMFGVLERPDEWEPVADWPEDWPWDELRDVAAKVKGENAPGGDDDPLVVSRSPAASHECLAEATLHFAEGNSDTWRPPKPVSCGKLVERWPALRQAVGGHGQP